jgi:uncharacterized protein YfaT (DUF1175 family)
MCKEKVGPFMSANVVLEGRDEYIKLEINKRKPTDLMQRKEPSD